MRDGEEECEDDAGEAQLESEVRQASGELVALERGFCRRCCLSARGDGSGRAA